ncbi:MAG TPA: glycosyltransferase, partial [Terriglobales bacterium]|nr:glycosyltransferase [Terriglobales bacterium]
MTNPRSNPDERPRLLYVVTSAKSVRLLRGQLRYMAAAGFDVTMASAPGPELDAAAEQDGVRTVAVPMAGGLSPLSDLKALRALRRLMQEVRPHITNVSTTKAGLIGGLAARSAGV